MGGWVPTALSTAALAAAIAASWIAWSSGSADDPPRAPTAQWERVDLSDTGSGDAESERIELRDLLATEYEQRLLLEERVTRLEEAMGLAGNERTGAGSPAEEREREQEEDGDPEDADADEEPRPVGAFDARRLVRAGVPPARTEELLDRWEEYMLEKAELNDLANREGWARTLDHLAAHQELDARFHEEVGDAGLDAVLYATGRPNRVEVTQVLGGSTADRSGVRSGDVVVSYGGRRIFDQDDLREVTTQGPRDEEVELRVMRDGRERRLFVRRGPLGSMVRATRAEPLP